MTLHCFQHFRGTMDMTADSNYLTNSTRAALSLPAAISTAIQCTNSEVGASRHLARFAHRKAQDDSSNASYCTPHREPPQTRNANQQQHLTPLQRLFGALVQSPYMDVYIKCFDKTVSRKPSLSTPLNNPLIVPPPSPNTPAARASPARLNNLF